MKIGNPFQTKQGNRPFGAIRRSERAQLKSCREPRCSPRVGPVCRETFGVAVTQSEPAWYNGNSSEALRMLAILSSTESEGSQVALVVKNLPANAGDIRDVGLIPWLGRSPGGGHGNPLQHSCLKNPMDRGSWWAKVHGGHKESDRTY